MCGGEFVVATDFVEFPKRCPVKCSWASKKRDLYSTNKLIYGSQAIKGVIGLCLLVKGGQNSTPEAQKGGPFRRTYVYTSMY